MLKYWQIEKKIKLNENCDAVSMWVYTSTKPLYMCIDAYTRLYFRRSLANHLFMQDGERLNCG